jgi:peptidoglycan/LPS O-acetylase OafA/YrhL
MAASSSLNPVTVPASEPDCRAPGARQHTDHRRVAWVGVLDALRGSAALYVVFNHVTVVLFPTYRESVSLGEPVTTRLTAAALSIFGFGHEAVILFFVLSGFCIHFRQAQHIRSAADGHIEPFRFDVRGYIVRRLRRIVPPFYFALLLTAALDYVASVLNPGFSAHFTGERLADQILVQNISLRTLAANLVFLQWLGFPTFGNNTALWSLAYEFYLYLLYPALLTMRLRFGPQLSLVGVALSSATAFGLLRIAPWAGMLWVVAYWLCWSLGAFAAEVYVGNASSRRLLFHPVLIGVLGLAWLASVKLFALPVVVFDSAGAILCMLLLIRLLDDTGGKSITLPLQKLFSTIGRFSYSLYLTHVPVVCLICTWWFIDHNRKPTNPMVALCGVLVAVAVGWGAYLLVESKTLSRGS